MLSLIANSEPSIRRTKCGHARRQVIIPSLSVPARCQVTDGVTEVPHAKNADAAAAPPSERGHLIPPALEQTSLTSSCVLSAIWIFSAVFLVAAPKKLDFESLESDFRTQVQFSSLARVDSCI